MLSFCARVCCLSLALGIVTILSLIGSGAAIAQTVTDAEAQAEVPGINPKVICSADYDISAYSDAPIAPLDMTWERQAEKLGQRYQKEFRHDENGIHLPEDFFLARVFPHLDGEAFVVDKATGRYVLALPGDRSPSCVIEFSSAVSPVWADRICVGHSLAVRTPPEIDLSTCPKAADIAHYLHFVSNVLSGYFYFPGHLRPDSYEMDKYEVVLFEKFSEECWRQHKVNPSTVEQSRRKKQFVSLFFEDFDGKVGAIFSNECMVGVARDAMRPQAEILRPPIAGYVTRSRKERP